MWILLVYTHFSHDCVRASTAANDIRFISLSPRDHSDIPTHIIIHLHALCTFVTMNRTRYSLHTFIGTLFHWHLTHTHTHAPYQYVCATPDSAWRPIYYIGIRYTAAGLVAMYIGHDEYCNITKWQAWICSIFPLIVYATIRTRNILWRCALDINKMK